MGTWRPIHYVLNTLGVSFAVAAIATGLMISGHASHLNDNKVRIAKVEACTTLSEQAAIALCLREIRV